jgi:hypothetical protein
MVFLFELFVEIFIEGIFAGVCYLFNKFLNTLQTYKRIWDIGVGLNPYSFFMPISIRGWDVIYR